MSKKLALLLKTNSLNRRIGQPLFWGTVLFAGAMVYLVYTMQIQNVQGQAIHQAEAITAHTLALPPTIVHLITSQVNEKELSQVRFISPWPINRDNAPQPGWETKAMTALTVNPQEAHTSLDVIQDKYHLRYMSAAFASSASCAACHNNDPTSPRQNFIKGDVMGAILVDIPLGDAFDRARAQIVWLSIMVLLAVAGLISFILVFQRRFILQPVRHLTNMAQQVTHEQNIAPANDAPHTPEPTKSSQSLIQLPPKTAHQDEIEFLTVTFTAMTQQLQNLINTLEDRVEQRTQALQTNVNISYHLTSYLDPNELLPYVVSRLQAEYHYYKIQFYLLDEAQENWVLAEETGRANEHVQTYQRISLKRLTIIMPNDVAQANIHKISVSAPKSLIAAAGRSAKIVRVDDTHQSSVWLKNPRHPNTRSEMAVPVIVENKVIGMVDVQEDHVAAFDEGEANLLLSLANQIGVALRNAQLYSLSQQEIAERKRAETALQEANTALAKTNADKDKFFSIVAHDLKGPFMPLLGYSDMLMDMADTLPPADIKEMSQAIHRSAQSTFSLLESLLEWSRLQMGRMVCQPKQINLTDLIDSVIDVLAENAFNKGIHLQSKQTEAVFALADYYMINTVIRNLVANALKFTKADAYVRVSAEHYDVEFVQVAVEDTGVGISQEDIEKIFKLDVYHSTSGTAQERGTGLGLIMCQEMVQQNGGRIWIESIVGKGTTVYFILPRFLE